MAYHHACVTPPKAYDGNTAAIVHMIFGGIHSHVIALVEFFSNWQEPISTGAGRLPLERPEIRLRGIGLHLQVA